MSFQELLKGLKYFFEMFGMIPGLETEVGSESDINTVSLLNFKRTKKQIKGSKYVSLKEGIFYKSFGQIMNYDDIVLGITTEAKLLVDERLKIIKAIREADNISILELSKKPEPMTEEETVKYISRSIIFTSSGSICPYTTLNKDILTSIKDSKTVLEFVNSDPNSLYIKAILQIAYFGIPHNKDLTWYNGNLKVAFDNNVTQNITPFDNKGNFAIDIERKKVYNTDKVTFDKVSNFYKDSISGGAKTELLYEIMEVEEDIVINL